MRTLLAVALVVFGSAGCSRETPIPTQLHTPPFNMLRGVELGMKAADLSASRSVAGAPDQRYAEDVAGYNVVYEFDESERLQAVGVSQSDQNTDAALLRYTRSVLEATRMLGVTPACRYHEPSNAMITLYQLRDAFYEISYTQRSGPAVSRSYRQEPSPIWALGEPQRCVR